MRPCLAGRGEVTDAGQRQTGNNGLSGARGAGLLSPRGKVLERDMPRFFRRLAEGVFDLDDLRFRTHELAGFVAAINSKKQDTRAHRGIHAFTGPG